MAPNNDRRPKHIVLCSDGTGNRGDKIRGTNVWKIFQAVDRSDHLHDDTLPQQIAFHDDGVGTESFKLLKYIGGAFGWGLSQNIRDLYTFLVKNYELGDQIFLFGFSRGAFTIRSLAGMIYTVGIVDKHRPELKTTRALDDAVGKAFEVYRGWKKKPDLASRFRDENCVRHETFAPAGEVKIRFVGVWDTVDAIGVPVDEIRKHLLERFIDFHRHDITDAMENGYHAISIDDERKTFDPVMWDEENKNARQQIEQVWFAGVHSNVGGGYPREELASITLDWMMAQAEKHGLRFDQDMQQTARREANPHGRLYDSRSGLAAYYRYSPRDIEDICCKAQCGKPKIHISVFDRIQRVTADYAPGSFPGKFDVAITEWRGQESDQEDVRRYEAIANQIEERQKQPDQKLIPDLTRVPELIGKRKLMYYGFLLWSMVTLVLAILAQAKLPEIPECVCDDSLSIEPGAGWWTELGADLVASLVPSFAENIARSLWDHPLIVLALAAVLVALVVTRRRVEGQYKHACLDAWRPTLTPPLTGEASTDGPSSTERTE